MLLNERDLKVMKAVSVLELISYLLGFVYLFRDNLFNNRFLMSGG